MNYDFSGVDAAKKDHDLYGLRYAQFVVPLVKPVQELNKLNNEKDEAIQQQNAKIDELKKKIASNALNSQQSFNSSGALLLQNTPNPFSNTTIIKYILPAKYISANIIVSDKNGNALKQINLSNANGSIQVNAAIMAAGAYEYSLYVNNKLVDTKQMILNK